MMRIPEIHHDIVLTLQFSMDHAVNVPTYGIVYIDGLSNWQWALDG